MRDRARGDERLPEVELRFEDVEALETEVETNLSTGRAFVAGATGVQTRSACALVLVHPDTGDTLRLSAEAVWVKEEEPGLGIGFELREFDADAGEALAAFVREKPEDQESVRRKSIAERVREYSASDRLKAAREGEYAERIALERAFGKSVWEALLQNQRITLPELASIARKGNVPTPVLETIATNPAWTGSPEVRRALLANPRLSAPSADRLLRLLSRAELKRVPRQNHLPPAIRTAAQKILARSSS